MKPASAEPSSSPRVARLEALIGKEVLSPWFLIDQKRIDGFADVTDDHQFLHVDVDAAAKGPFGGTIAHGFLSLSMLSAMAASVLPIEGMSAALNYGFDRVRFLAPVPSGARIRGHFTVAKVSTRGAGQILLQYQANIEIEGHAKPAASADWLVLLLSNDKENQE